MWPPRVFWFAFPHIILGKGVTLNFTVLIASWGVSISFSYLPFKEFETLVRVISFFELSLRLKDLVGFS